MKLAFCIPTYGRSLEVSEFLEQYALLFYESGIDICYYDSSEDSKTKVVVKQWMDLYDNIYYINIPSDWHANHKVMYIYKQYAQSQKYDYLWICGDSIRYSEKIVKQIMGVLDSEYDMIIINGIDRGRIGTRMYTDGNELFQDCAWHMTLFGAVVVNVHTVLKHVLWSYIQEKYEIPERINYSHIGLYFETICKLDKFTALYLAADGELQGSLLRKKAGWYQEAFKVLCEYWPSTIEALPEYYTDKWEAINKLGYYSCLMPWDFLNYWMGDIYNFRIFLKYRTILKGMSHLNSVQLWSLACLNPKRSYYIATNDLKGYIKEKQKVRSLQRFCKRNRNIYIYGAGLVAKRYSRYLESKGIHYQGFLVTQKENMEKFHNHPVIPFSEFVSSYDGAGIIIGLNHKNMKEVQPMLMEHGVWEHSFHEYIMPVMLTDWKKER